MQRGSSLLAPIARMLEDKVAVITGGASGIGESTARLFVHHGAKVVVADIQDNLGQSLCQDINKESESVSFVHCDVSSDSDVQNLVNHTIDKYGKLDIMFSNAGISGNVDPSILSVNYEEYKKVFDVNVFGAYACAKHAARVMIPAKRGSIVFTSSAVVVTHGITPHLYTGSKNAVAGLTKNLCVELGKFGIRVNSVAPFAVATPMVTKSFGFPNQGTAEKFIGKAANLKEAVLRAEDVAEAALYLGSDQSKYVSGINLVVDGGYSTTNIAFNEAIKEYKP